jgi:hypothetical protein
MNPILHNPVEISDPAPDFPEATPLNRTGSTGSIIHARLDVKRV